MHMWSTHVHCNCSFASWARSKIECQWRACGGEQALVFAHNNGVNYVVWCATYSHMSLCTSSPLTYARRFAAAAAVCRQTVLSILCTWASSQYKHTKNMRAQFAIALMICAAAAVDDRVASSHECRTNEKWLWNRVALCDVMWCICDDD